MSESKTVLVTGAGGFIGSHLVERLVAEGHRVRAFVRYTAMGQAGWLERSPSRGSVELLPGDLRDYDSVRSAMKGADIVFHLGALIAIPYSYVSPLAYVKTNIEGTYNVLQACRDLGVGRVVHTSTSEIYGTAQYVPIDEGHPVHPQSPYAATKSAADHLALSYHRSFDLPVTVVRPFNTFGPRQSARAIIPAVAVQVLSGARTIRLGNPNPTRDLTFVDDTVNGFLQVGLHPDTVGEVVNFGTGREIAVGELARKIIALAGSDAEIVIDRERFRPARSEVERLLSNPSKAERLTGWSAKVSFDEGLARTVAWIKENLDSFRAERYQV